MSKSSRENLPRDLRYVHVWERLLYTPLVLRPEKAEILARVIFRREQSGMVVLSADGDDDSLPIDGGTPERMMGYSVHQNIAVIPVCGTLVHKLGGVRPYSGMLGYDSIRANFADALANKDVKGILLECDSPGGEGAGCFDLVDAMYEERGTKPVWACLDENACSGAYAIASVADRITIPRTGLAGSIGVVVMHVDFSAALEKEGCKVTFIQYGACKTDGAPQIPLSKSALDRAQGQVDAMGDLFVETVARNRKMAAAKVKAQEADIYQGRRALDVGLADAVMPKDQAFAEFHEFLFPKGR